VIAVRIGIITPVWASWARRLNYKICITFANPAKKQRNQKRFASGTSRSFFVMVRDGYLNISGSCIKTNFKKKVKIRLKVTSLVFRKRWNKTWMTCRMASYQASRGRTNPSLLPIINTIQKLSVDPDAQSHDLIKYSFIFFISRWWYIGL